VARDKVALFAIARHEQQPVTAARGQSRQPTILPLFPATRAASRRPGCGPSPGSRRPQGRGGRAIRAVCRAAVPLPMRTGGLDQIPASRGGTSAESGKAQRTLDSPARAALAAHKARARSLTVNRPDRRAGGAGRERARDRGRTRSPGQGCPPTGAARAPPRGAARFPGRGGRGRRRRSRSRAPGTGRAGPPGPGRAGAPADGCDVKYCCEPVTGPLAAAAAGRTRRPALGRFVRPGHPPLDEERHDRDRAGQQPARSSAPASSSASAPGL